MFDFRVTDPDFTEALININSIWRRYTEFELLRAYLEVSYPYIVLPTLPEKKATYTWRKISTDTYNPDFVDRRRAGLEVKTFNNKKQTQTSNTLIKNSFINVAEFFIEDSFSSGFVL